MLYKKKLTIIIICHYINLMIIIQFQKKYQEELKIWEDEQAKMKPWLAEIAECDRIIEYLKPMIPKKVVEQDSASKKSVVLKMADGTVIQSMSKKGSSDESSIGLSGFPGKKKKKRRRNRERDLERPIKHSIDIISTFKKMEISLPKYVYTFFQKRRKKINFSHSKTKQIHDGSV